jgi:predicted nuclease of predicted toxin-antitoxin system
MRVLVDMNLTLRWVTYLNQRGCEAAHWSSIGLATAKDSDLCDYAREHGYAILTNDLDFPQILAHSRQGSPSIILLRGQPLVPEERGTALVNALKECERVLKSGAIVTLDWTDRLRVRVLPLR